MYIEVNGEKTFYSVGNGSIKAEQQSVVFVHGAGMDHSVWTMCSRYFARHGYNVFAFDLPAHGRSSGEPLASIEAMSAWLKSALDVLEIEQAAVVGHSMGSLVALSFAAQYPERTRAMALLGTSTPMPVGAVLLDAARDNSHDAIDMANTWSHSSFGLMGGNENPGMCMTMGGQRLIERTADGVYFADFNACNEFSNGEELAASIKANTLIVVGMQDKMTMPVNALKVAEIIDGANVVKLDPCGHSMMSEQPNKVLDALATIV